METDAPNTRVPCDFSRHVCRPCGDTVCAGTCHACACSRCGVSHKERPLYGDGEDGFSFCERCEEEMEAQQRVMDERRRVRRQASIEAALAKAIATRNARLAASKQRQSDDVKRRSEANNAQRLEAEVRFTMEALKIETQAGEASDMS